MITRQFPGRSLLSKRLTAIDRATDTEYHSQDVMAAMPPDRVVEWMAVLVEWEASSLAARSKMDNQFQVKEQGCEYALFCVFSN